MRKLSEQEIERIVSLLKEGKPLPEDYKPILFDTKKEYELIYADKVLQEDANLLMYYQNAKTRLGEQPEQLNLI